MIRRAREYLLRIFSSSDLTAQQRRHWFIVFKCSSEPSNYYIGWILHNRQFRNLYHLWTFCKALLRKVSEKYLLCVAIESTLFRFTNIFLKVFEGFFSIWFCFINFCVFKMTLTKQFLRSAFLVFIPMNKCSLCNLSEKNIWKIKQSKKYLILFCKIVTIKEPGNAFFYFAQNKNIFTKNKFSFVKMPWSSAWLFLPIEKTLIYF